MKTIGYKDKAGGSIHIYKNASKPDQTRHERIREALKDLKHTGNINIYLINGRKVRKIASKGM
jgi:trehalose-6-phosphatase